MKKTALIIITAFMAAVFGFSEIKYIEIKSAEDIPIIYLKRIEDLEEIINEYGVKIGYRGNGFLIVCAENAYFHFPMNGYYTISDYKTGESLKFKTGNDFYEATLELGFEDSQSYYFYKSNDFASKNDTVLALKNGFKNSRDFYDARQNGISTNSDYQNFLAAEEKGFDSTSDYFQAMELKFSYGREYYSAMEAGFHNADEVKAAAEWGLPTFSDYETFLKVQKQIDSFCEKNKLTKEDAFVFYLISNIKKGEEFSLSALSRRLREDSDKMGDYVSYAIRKYIDIRRLSDCFDPSSLNDFLNRVPLEKTGKWNAKSEIFKKS